MRHRPGSFRKNVSSTFLHSTDAHKIKVIYFQGQGVFDMALTLALVMAQRKKIDDPHKAINLALGKRLAHFRNLRGLSQRELAQRVNVVQAVISDYEVGKLRLTAEAALRFAAALDVPIQELLQTAKPPEVAKERKPSRKMLQRLEQIEGLPRRKQEALLTTIDAFLDSAAG
jgi:transcriptional regulator with XRE-family HTH domain